jgi:hypothetical protein
MGTELCKQAIPKPNIYTLLAPICNKINASGKVILTHNFHPTLSPLFPQ